MTTRVRPAGRLTGAAPRWFSGTLTTRTRIGAIALTALALQLRYVVNIWRWSFGDLAVYRRGGAAIVGGRSIFVHTAGLPFTYPPFSAVLSVPMYLIGSVAAAAVMTALSLGCYVVFAALLARSLGFDPRAVFLLTVGGVAMEPVIHTLRLGQVNLLLAALVTVDCLALQGSKSRYRGLLVGVAAGIKIVPGVFVIYFLLRREWAAVARSAAGFAATVVISALVDAHDTRQFWTGDFYSADHVGGVAYVANQSIFGVLVRLTHNEHPPTILSHGLQLAALALATVAAARQLRSGPGRPDAAGPAEAAAMTCIGIGGLLASPISWSHHWVWLVPAVMVLLARGQWRWAGALAAIGYLAPEWFTPSTGLREFHHTWWQAVLCSLTCASGIVFLLLMLRSPGIHASQQHLRGSTRNVRA